MLCIHVILVSMGTFIPWRVMTVAFLLSPWLGLRVLSETIPLMYRASITKRFRLMLILTSTAKIVQLYRYMTTGRDTKKSTNGDFEMALWRLNVSPAAPLT